MDPSQEERRRDREQDIALAMHRRDAVERFSALPPEARRAVLEAFDPDDDRSADR